MSNTQRRVDRLSALSADTGLHMLACGKGAVLPFFCQGFAAAYRFRAENAAEAQDIGDPKRRFFKLIAGYARGCSCFQRPGFEISYRQIFSVAEIRKWCSE